jgi:AP-3 complex subunit beta
LISKGRDASSLFPAVVKNVISKNVELKKLVYMYLVHYAELEPDSALLAINSFQKDLGAASQYIRGKKYTFQVIIYLYFIIASALRVLSSIRVKIIVQIIVLAIQKCVKDTSPYVRKTAAHAISKVYS